jgi:hypothetical protein
MMMEDATHIVTWVRQGITFTSMGDLEYCNQVKRHGTTDFGITCIVVAEIKSIWSKP